MLCLSCEAPAASLMFVLTLLTMSGVQRNVSLLVGMPTKSEKCGSLHGANRLGAR